MTFEDDFLQLNFLGGMRRVIRLKAMNLTWPPPPQIDFMGFPMVRTAMSDITDEQRHQMTHVARGADYHPPGGTPAARSGAETEGKQT